MTFSHYCRSRSPTPCIAPLPPTSVDGCLGKFAIVELSSPSPGVPLVAATTTILIRIRVKLSESSGGHHSWEQVKNLTSPREYTLGSEYSAKVLPIGYLAGPAGTNLCWQGPSRTVGSVGEECQ